MSLIKCPECNNFVSDTALQCPKCGYSIKDNFNSSLKEKLQTDLKITSMPPKQNNGCGIALVVFIGFLFLLFLINKCSKTDSYTKTNDLEQIDTKMSKEDSLKNKARTDSIEKQEKIEEDKFSKTKAGKIYKKHPEWSKEDCINISENRIWIGMHYDMLVYERGKPDNINTSNYGDGTNYQACWHDYQASCFYFDESQIITSYN